MIKTIFASLFLCLLATFQLNAQCTTTGNPAVSIGSFCAQSPGNYVIPVNVENWGGLHAWNLNFCLNTAPGVTLTNAVSLVNGQTISFNNINSLSDVSIYYGTQGDCNGAPRLRGSTIAELTITVASKAARGNCASVGFCYSNKAYECSGNYILQHSVIGCGGEVCYGSGSPYATISGTIKSLNGSPLAGVEVGNSLNSSTVFTNSQGDYIFNNLWVDCETEVEITPYYNGPSGNGIDQDDVDLVTDYLQSNATLNCEEMLAADVNYSGTVNVIDRNALNYFVNNPSLPTYNTGYWRYYPAGTTLICNPGSNSLTPPPYSITVQVGVQPVTGVDFTGSKAGDLTGNASSKTQQEASASSRPIPEKLIASPNPFSDIVTLRFSLQTEGEVTLKVIDLTGKVLELKTLPLQEGSQELDLDGRDWPRGILMYQLETGAKRYSGRFLHLN